MMKLTSMVSTRRMTRKSGTVPGDLRPQRLWWQTRTSTGTLRRQGPARPTDTHWTRPWGVILRREPPCRGPRIQGEVPRRRRQAVSPKRGVGRRAQRTRHQKPRSQRSAGLVRAPKMMVGLKYTAYRAACNQAYFLDVFRQ